MDTLKGAVKNESTHTRARQAHVKMKKAAVDASIEELRGLMPKVVRNVEAIILWQLHEQFGFGGRGTRKNKTI